VGCGRQGGELGAMGVGLWGEVPKKERWGRGKIPWGVSGEFFNPKRRDKVCLNSMRWWRGGGSGGVGRLRHGRNGCGV